MLIAYLYNTTLNSRYSKGLASIYDLDKTLKIFKEYHPEYINFLGTHLMFRRAKDGIILYRKFN